jgi:hypothetical protein
MSAAVYYRDGCVDSYTAVALHSLAYPEAHRVAVNSAREVLADLRRAPVRSYTSIHVFGVDLTEHDYITVALIAPLTWVVTAYSFQTAGFRPGAEHPLTHLPHTPGRIVSGARAISALYLTHLRCHNPTAAARCTNDMVVRALDDYVASSTLPVSACSSAIFADLSSMPRTVELWRELFLPSGPSEELKQLIVDGSAIERYVNSQVSQAADRATRTGVAFDNYKLIQGYGVNVSAAWACLVASSIPRVDYDEEFGMGWFVEDRVVHCRLYTRSTRVLDLIRTHVTDSRPARMYPSTYECLEFSVAARNFFTQWH